jgi:hypothetical protein
MESGQRELEDRVEKSFPERNIGLWQTVPEVTVFSFFEVKTRNPSVHHECRDNCEPDTSFRPRIIKFDNRYPGFMPPDIFPRNPRISN